MSFSTAINRHKRESGRTVRKQLKKAPTETKRD